MRRHLAPNLKRVEVKQQKNQTSLFFTLDGHFTHKIFRLSQPERVVVDFSGTRLTMNLQQPGLRNALIRQIRVGHANDRIICASFWT